MSNAARFSRSPGSPAQGRRDRRRWRSLHCLQQRRGNGRQELLEPRLQDFLAKHFESKLELSEIQHDATRALFVTSLRRLPCLLWDTDACARWACAHSSRQPLETGNARTVQAVHLSANFCNSTSSGVYCLPLQHTGLPEASQQGILSHRSCVLL